MHRAGKNSYPHEKNFKKRFAAGNEGEQPSKHHPIRSSHHLLFQLAEPKSSRPLSALGGGSTAARYDDLPRLAKAV
jgi:hypothetical protein